MCRLRSDLGDVGSGGLRVTDVDWFRMEGAVRMEIGMDGVGPGGKDVDLDKMLRKKKGEKGQGLTHLRIDIDVSFGFAFEVTVR